MMTLFFLLVFAVANQTPPLATPQPEASMGIPVHVKPPSGVVSPEPGGSALLTHPPSGERIVPRCEHDPNPGDMLRLETAVYELTIGKTLYLRRKLTFSPTTAWKPFCDHVFFLGEPETAWTIGAKTHMQLTLPPRPPRELVAESRTLATLKKAVAHADQWVGAVLTFAPLPGNPADHRMVIDIEQDCTVFPEAGEDGVISLYLPLSYLDIYTSSTNLRVEIQVEFQEPWHFLGASFPESRVLDNRISWTISGVPEKDLKILFSDTAPVETPYENVTPQETLGDQIIRLLLLGLIVLIPLGILLYIVFVRYRRKNVHEEK